MPLKSKSKKNTKAKSPSKKDLAKGNLKKKGSKKSSKKSKSGKKVTLKENENRCPTCKVPVVCKDYNVEQRPDMNVNIRRGTCPKCGGKTVKFVKKQ